MRRRLAIYIGSLGLAAVLIVALVAILIPAGVSVTSEGKLSLEAHIVLAAQTNEASSKELTRYAGETIIVEQPWGYLYTLENGDIVEVGDSTKTDTKLVTTEIEEYSASIPLNAPLYGNSSGIRIWSNNPLDSVKATSYDKDTQEVFVVGFAEHWTILEEKEREKVPFPQERILTITYPCLATYEVKYRHPDHVEEGYVKPTEEVKDWVIIADPTPVLMPRETRGILVVLAMPEDAAVFAFDWEFWISVKDTTQEGMVQTELCTRWLVTMRP